MPAAAAPWWHRTPMLVPVRACPARPPDEVGAVPVVTGACGRRDRRGARAAGTPGDGPGDVLRQGGTVQA